MSDLKATVDYAKLKGLTRSSRILNVTHFDLDGVVSTVNLLNYVNNFDNFFYVTKNYDNVNEFFTEILFKDNCTFKRPDFVIVTDISVRQDVIDAFQDRPETIIVLDHHETAYELNKNINCYVDETETKCGSEVTLDFMKGMGYEKDNLDKLNRIATQYDLFLFKNEECRKFQIGDSKRSLAEMFNTMFFKTRDKDEFIERWRDGWGKGFNKEEVEIIKSEYLEAEEHINSIKGSDRLVELDEDKVLILSGKFINHAGEYFLDTLGKSLMLTCDVSRCKISARVNDKSNINIGKILKLMHEKFDFMTNGGGHAKAGGCNISNIDHLDTFVEKVLLLASHFEKNESKS